MTPRLGIFRYLHIMNAPTKKKSVPCDRTRAQWQRRVYPGLPRALQFHKRSCGATARNCYRSRWSLRPRLRLPATDDRSARGISKLPRYEEPGTYSGKPTTFAGTPDPLVAAVAASIVGSGHPPTCGIVKTPPCRARGAKEKPADSAGRMVEFRVMVRKAGLEPACLAAPPPQDGVSASFTTSALPSKYSRYSGNAERNAPQGSTSSAHAVEMPGRVISKRAPRSGSLHN